MRRRLGTGLAALAGLLILVGCTTSGTGPDLSGEDSRGPDMPVPDAEPSPAALEAPSGRSALSGERIGLPAEPGLKRSPPSPLIKPLPPEVEQTPQAGLLTAGDYDDVLNPDLYKAYLDRVLQGALSGKGLPYVDANRRIQITVLDRLGKPMPLARIAVTDAEGQPLFPLRTGANGLAYLYPNYDQLTDGVTLSVSSPGARTMKRQLGADLLAAGGEVIIDISKDAQPAGHLDLLLTLDATGSMADEMAYLQVELVAILDRVRSRLPGLDIRVGFVVYRDVGDDYVVREFAFTEDLSGFKSALSEQEAQGGGDMPEAMHTALEAGLAFDWREDAVKVNLLVADAPPHDDEIEASWASGLISRSRGIHIVSLAASGVDDTAEFLMRGLSQLTGGRYLFLTDDSGIGRPHAEPKVDCYVVTRLDGLMERVLEGLVTGRRVEPEGDMVLRTVGNYRAGICAPEGAETD